MVGMVGTLAIGHDPGFLLGFLIVAGSVVATLAIRQRAAYQIIPLPALTYLIVGVITGAIHDRAADVSRAQLEVNFAQWIASGFLAMSAATILVIVVAGARWILRRRVVSGQFPVSEQRSAQGHAPPRRSPAPLDPWEDRRDGRPARDRRLDDRNPRDSRDPWDRRR